MFDCHVYCYPWDLLDEGLDEVLDRLHDQVGATGLTLVAVGDDEEQFRPHQSAEPRIYRTAGGVYFQPNEQYYQATRLKPPLWDQHRKMDVLAKISEGCASRQLDLRLNVSLFYSRRLVAKHPEVTCKNAYGISSCDAMCAINPDVQQYLVSLLRDLSDYDDVSAIVLEDIERPSATDSDPYMQAMAMFDTDVIDLLSICFCESCLQAADRAGVDGQAAQRCARAVLDRLSQEGVPQDWNMEDLLEDNPPVARYVEWADASLLELFGRLREVISKSLIFNFRDASRSFINLARAGDLFALADAVILDAEDLEDIIGELSRGEVWSGALRPASVRQMEILLRMDEGLIDEAPEVVRQLSWAAEAGAAGATITHFGAILEHQFDWLHQGLRNARRLTSS